MSGKAHITAEFATPADVATRLRIPATRTAQLRRLMADVVIRMPDGSVNVFEVKRSGNTSGRNRSKGPASPASRTSPKKK